MKRTKIQRYRDIVTDKIKQKKQWENATDGTWQRFMYLVRRCEHWQACDHLKIAILEAKIERLRKRIHLAEEYRQSFIRGHDEARGFK